MWWLDYTTNTSPTSSRTKKWSPKELEILQLDFKISFDELEADVNIAHKQEKTLLVKEVPVA